MFLFEDDKCPVCGMAFEKGDDIVVCPDCGTPHHRLCYDSLRHCKNSDLHHTDFKFQRAASTAEDGESAENDNKNSKKNGPQRPNPQIKEKVTGLGEPATREDVKKIASNATGEDSNETPTIEGVNVYDAALVIGNNTQYYLPRFISKRGMKWNWGAFIFGPYYFLFRKMYSQGFGLIILETFANILLSAIYSSELSTFYTEFSSLISDGTIDEAAMQAFMQTSTFKEAMVPSIILALITIVIHIFTGIFANKFYLKKVVNGVKKVDENLNDPSTVNGVISFGSQNENMSSEDIRKLYLTKQGGTSWLIPVLVYFVLNILTQIL